jgi:hypothetical protein
MLSGLAYWLLRLLFLTSVLLQPGCEILIRSNNPLQLGFRARSYTMRLIDLGLLIFVGLG